MTMDNGTPWEMGLFLVCVDAWGPKGCSGRYTSPALGESGTFRDLGRLLMHLESCLNIHDQPQSFCVPRQFTDGPELWPSQEPPQRIRPGNLATFHIRIRFRRNASWQGTVTWLERHKTMPFRSALELLGLMDSVLSDYDGAAIPLRMEG